MSRAVYRILAVGMLFAYAAAPAAAHTNRDDVKRNIQDGWVVVWAREINEVDYLECLGVIGVSVASSNLGPL